MLFLASVYFLDARIPAVYCVLIIVRCGQGGLKSFCKDDERLARNEAFCGYELARNGVCKRQVTLYLQFYAQRASSCPQVSPNIVGNGEKSRVEALLVARFDAEDLADERSTSVAQLRQQETSAKEIVSFYS